MRCWDQLRRAIRDQVAVHITYLSLQGQETEREIFPLGLFYWGGKWTIGAWCTLRQAYRDFRVDLILTIVASTTAKPLGGHISFGAYIQHHAENCNDPS